MRKINAFIAILIFASGGAFSQGNEFIKSYGNTGYDYGRDIVQDNDTGYVVTGSSSSFGPDNGEAYLLKLDVDGAFEWSHNYGGPGSEWGHTVVVTNDSTYAIGGYTNSYGAGGFDFYLVRIAADGTPLWENYYGGANWDRSFGMIQLADSGFVLVGESYSFNGGIQSGYIVRTDKDGEMVWESFIDEPVPSFFKDIVLDGDSIVLCGGIGDGGEDSFDGFIAKYHIDGTPGWDRRIGGEHNDYFNAAYSVGGFYSFGGARGYNFPTEKENLWVYRLDDVGNEVGDTVYSTLSEEKDIIHDIWVRGDQDLTYAGETESWGNALSDGKSDYFYGKTSPSYNWVVGRNDGEAGVDALYAVAPTRGGGVVMVGDTEYRFLETGGNNVIVLKIGPGFANVPFAEGDLNDITSSIDELTNELGILEVYPNPFNDVVHLPSIDKGTFAVYSIDGQLIEKGELLSNQINLETLRRGTYILTVETEEGRYRKRLVKN